MTHIRRPLSTLPMQMLRGQLVSVNVITVSVFSLRWRVVKGV
jgi:hypothetical protein